LGSYQEIAWFGLLANKRALDIVNIVLKVLNLKAGSVQVVVIHLAHHAGLVVSEPSPLLDKFPFQSWHVRHKARLPVMGSSESGMWFSPVRKPRTLPLVAGQREIETNPQTALACDGQGDHSRQSAFRNRPQTATEARAPLRQIPLTRSP
jgi:hypothetical protein